MDRLKRLETLIKVVEAGGLSKAARAIGTGQPAVSKAIDALERDFSVKLLNRSTRHVSLTEDGARFYEESRRVVDAYGALSEEAARKSVAAGLVRVTCPNALGSVYLIPKLREFLDLYPKIRVELHVTDAFVDLYEQDIDVALRVGEPHDERLIARKVCELRRYAVAATSYLAANPAPRRPQDLRNHSCIIAGRADARAEWLYLTKSGSQSSVTVTGKVVVDNFLALRTCVEAGLGIGLAAAFIYDPGSMTSGRVQRVLPHIEFTPLPLSVMFKDARLLPARVRVFLDFLLADLKRQPWAKS
jgi:DNA-binding transcriptional LysR family regulator